MDTETEPISPGLNADYPRSIPTEPIEVIDTDSVAVYEFVIYALLQDLRRTLRMSEERDGCMNHRESTRPR